MTDIPQLDGDTSLVDPGTQFGAVCGTLNIEPDPFISKERDPQVDGEEPEPDLRLDPRPNTLHDPNPCHYPSYSPDKPKYEQGPLPNPLPTVFDAKDASRDKVDPPDPNTIPVETTPHSLHFFKCRNCWQNCNRDKHIFICRFDCCDSMLCCVHCHKEWQKWRNDIC